MAYKAKDADRLNDQNEDYRMKREKQLKREIEIATQEPSAAANKKSEGRGRVGSSGATKGGVEEGVAAPSICPTTPLEPMVCQQLFS